MTYPESTALDPLLADAILASVTRALAEDVGPDGDITTLATVPADAVAEASFVAREAGVLAGLPVARVVYEAVGQGRVAFEPQMADGDRLAPGAVVASVRGPVRDLLTAERTALNFLGHLSGVASLTRQWVDAVEGTRAAVRDTRKTMPGLRLLEKYAVRCGGGVNHRMSLSDAALVKDNHVVAAGGVVPAFEAVRARYPEAALEIEVDTVEQAREVIEAGADLLLLDNMGVDDLRAIVAMTQGRHVMLEASGRLRLDNARAIAQTGVHYLSVGALTHSAAVLDIGLDM